MGVNDLRGDPDLIDYRPVWPKGLVPLPAHNVKDHVLQHTGARPWNRCELDKQLIENVKSEIGKIINSKTEAGGYPVIKPVYRKF